MRAGVQRAEPLGPLLLTPEVAPFRRIRYLWLGNRSTRVSLGLSAGVPECPRGRAPAPSQHRFPVDARLPQQAQSLPARS